MSVDPLDPAPKLNKCTDDFIDQAEDEIQKIIDEYEAQRKDVKKVSKA